MELINKELIDFTHKLKRCWNEPEIFQFLDTKYKTAFHNLLCNGQKIINDYLKYSFVSFGPPYNYEQINEYINMPGVAEDIKTTVNAYMNAPNVETLEDLRKRLQYGYKDYYWQELPPL